MIDKKELSELRRDAALWRKVKEIAGRYGVKGCETCPIAECPGGFICQHAQTVVKVLEAHDEPK